MRKIFALAILLSAVFAAPASAMTAQEFNIAEFAKANKAKRNYDPVGRHVLQPTTRAVRNTARQFTPRQVERNTRTILRAPLDAGKWIFDGVDGAGRYLMNRKGTNDTGMCGMHCGRAQRRANLENGFRDCAGGDLVSSWRSPVCSRPAPSGAINSLRVWSNGQHIERVVGTCGTGMVVVADNNGPGGVGTVRCVTIAGASYHYPLEKTGDAKIDGPFFMAGHYACRGNRTPRQADVPVQALDLQL